MVPAGEALRLEVEAAELRTAAEEERVVEAARAAVDALREAVDMGRDEAEGTERETVLAAEEAEREAEDMRPSDDPLVAALPVPAERVARTTRPTPARELGLMTETSARVASRRL